MDAVDRFLLGLAAAEFVGDQRVVEQRALPDVGLALAQRVHHLLGQIDDLLAHGGRRFVGVRGARKQQRGEKHGSCA